jgi:hypothetical protein
MEYSSGRVLEKASKEVKTTTVRHRQYDVLDAGWMVSHGIIDKG